MEVAESRLYFLIPFIMVVILIVPVFDLGVGWYNGQRAGQISIFVAVSIFYLRFSIIKYANKNFTLHFACCLFLLIGFACCSAILAEKKFYAFLEMSIFVSCVFLAYFLSYVRCKGCRKTDLFFVFFVLLLCSIKTVQFLSTTIGGFFSGDSSVDLWLLIDGFDNPRFYGQFQTLMFPILAVPLLGKEFSIKIKAFSFFLLSIWWVIEIVGATRGTLLGVGLASLILILVRGKAFELLKWEMLSLLFGAAIFGLVFWLLPKLLNIEIVGGPWERAGSGLSGRSVIWWQAIDMIKAHPVLGIGPMGFASFANPIAAHPHQALLQWAAEWGIPSTLIVLYVGFKGINSVFKKVCINSQSASTADVLRLCLFASLMGGLAQSMVDGVIVMPYSQLWLTIVIGWLMGLQPVSTGPETKSLLRYQRTIFISWVFLSLMSTGLLAYVVIRDVPNLKANEENYKRSGDGHYQPRFWMQGVTAEDK